MIILIKLGEIWLKGRNRGDFVDQLILNISQATGVNKKDISQGQGRLYINLNNDNNYDHDKILASLRYVFGIAGYAQAQKLPVDYGELKKYINTQYTGLTCVSFAVRAVRGLKDFEKDSNEINREIGELVIKNNPKLKVDLKNSDLEINIEVRKEGIFVYENYHTTSIRVVDGGEQKGAGGLPVGISEKGLLMLSGGIDSPVAGWHMLKRGMAVDAVYFHSPPFVGEKTKEKVKDLAKVLAKWKTAPVKLYVPHFTEIQTTINKDAAPGYWTLLHRRFMVKIAERIAEENKYSAIIKGDNLGQVASQTSQSIAAVRWGTNTPIHAPLIGFDKQETIDKARQIGTYELSILPYDDCCSVFAADNPKTKVKTPDILELEKKFDVEGLIKKALDKMEVYDID